jgi:hypothetical protein
MRLPNQAAPVTRFSGVYPVAGNVQPSDCPWYKKVACVAAALGCGVVCVGSWGTACLQCIGATVGGCGDCV